MTVEKRCGPIDFCNIFQVNGGNSNNRYTATKMEFIRPTVVKTDLILGR